MYHLLFVSCLLVCAFRVLLRQHAVEIAFALLAWFPPVTFLIAGAHEFVRGIHQFNHQLLHVAYDSSYALSLFGISLILRGVITRQRINVVLIATVVAAIPLAHLFITQP